MVPSVPPDAVIVVLEQKAPPPETVVAAGAGFTVTVMVKAGPAQEPAVAVGVTKY